MNIDDLIATLPVWAQWPLRNAADVALILVSANAIFATIARMTKTQRDDAWAAKMGHWIESLLSLWQRLPRHFVAAKEAAAEGKVTLPKETP